MAAVCSGLSLFMLALNTKVNLKYHVTLSRKVKVKVTSKGHNSVEVIKVYKPT